jgi:hypothetical protein
MVSSPNDTEAALGRLPALGGDPEARSSTSASVEYAPDPTRRVESETKEKGRTEAANKEAMPVTYSILIGGTIAIIIVGVPLAAGIARLLNRRKMSAEDQKIVQSFEKRRTDARYFWR